MKYFINIIIVSLTCLFLCAAAPKLQAENIDPDDNNSQFAWSENGGWMNLEPGTGDGVMVTATGLTGWIWSENIGWISLSCSNTSSCGDVNYGVTNNNDGTLGGYGWSENAGWISFACSTTGSCGDVSYGVTIDSGGNFGGYAWSENIGWISFSCENTGSCGAVDYGTQVCVVDIDDLQAFADQWLGNATSIANLNGDDGVDFADYAVLASWWQSYCPGNWPL